MARAARYSVEIALYVYYNIVKSCYFDKTFTRDLQTHLLLAHIYQT